MLPVSVFAEGSITHCEPRCAIEDVCGRPPTSESKTHTRRRIRLVLQQVINLTARAVLALALFALALTDRAKDCADKIAPLIDPTVDPPLSAVGALSQYDAWGEHPIARTEVRGLDSMPFRNYPKMLRIAC